MHLGTHPTSCLSMCAKQSTPTFFSPKPGLHWEATTAHTPRCLELCPARFHVLRLSLDRVRGSRGPQPRTYRHAEASLFLREMVG